MQISWLALMHPSLHVHTTKALLLFPECAPSSFQADCKPSNTNVCCFPRSMPLGWCGVSIPLLTPPTSPFCFEPPLWSDRATRLWLPTGSAAAAAAAAPDGRRTTRAAPGQAAAAAPPSPAAPTEAAAGLPPPPNDAVRGRAAWMFAGQVSHRTQIAKPHPTPLSLFSLPPPRASPQNEGPKRRFLVED